MRYHIYISDLNNQMMIRHETNTAVSTVSRYAIAGNVFKSSNTYYEIKPSSILNL